MFKGALFALMQLCLLVIVALVCSTNEDYANNLSGGLIGSFMLFAGFMITRTNIRPYFIWVYWLSPFR